MSWLRFFRRSRADAELQQEIDAYLAEETAENIARGVKPEEARRRAKLASGLHHIDAEKRVFERRCCLQCDRVEQLEVSRRVGSVGCVARQRDDPGGALAGTQGCARPTPW